MARITFSDKLFTDDASQGLKNALETYFNKPDVNEKMTAMVDSLFPDNTVLPPKGAPLSLVLLHDFKEPGTETDPHNLAAAVMHAWNYSEKRQAEQQPLPHSVQATLDMASLHVARLVANTKESSPLRDAIKSNIDRMVDRNMNQGRH